MHRPAATLTCFAVAAALGGCGGSDASSSSDQKTEPQAVTALALPRTGDLKGFSAANPRPVASARAMSELGQSSSPAKDLARLEKEGYETGSTVDLVPTAEDGTDSGYAVTERFKDAAGAVAEVQSPPQEVANNRLKAAKVPALPHGVLTVYTSTDRGTEGVGRNINFANGRMTYFIGFTAGNKATDPGNAALIAAAKKLLARAG